MFNRFDHCGFSPAARAGVTFAPLAAAGAAVAPYAAPALLGMNIIGGFMGNAAQQQAGQLAYQQALLRRQQAYQQAAMQDQQAAQLDENASTTTGEGQIAQNEQIRKGKVLAGRMRAAMAASGGGVDNNVIDGLTGVADYQGKVAAYDASERARGMRNQAIMDRYGAATTRWSGDATAGIGASEQAADNQAGTNSIIGGVGKGVLSFMSRYGGGGPPSSGDPMKFTAMAGTGGLDDASMQLLA